MPIIYGIINHDPDKLKVWSKIILDSLGMSAYT